MNIGIIGAGTASAICILTILNSIKNNRTNIDNVTITCISDPTSPMLK